jgi:hypothetical protein
LGYPGRQIKKAPLSLSSPFIKEVPSKKAAGQEKKKLLLGCGSKAAAALVGAKVHFCLLDRVKRHDTPPSAQSAVQFAKQWTLVVRSG